MFKYDFKAFFSWRDNNISYVLYFDILRIFCIFDLRWNIFIQFKRHFHPPTIFVVALLLSSLGACSIGSGFLCPPNSSFFPRKHPDLVQETKDLTGNRTLNNYMILVEDENHIDVCIQYTKDS